MGACSSCFVFNKPNIGLFFIVIEGKGAASFLETSHAWEEQHLVMTVNRIITSYYCEDL
jgi:hypothetical protein